MDWITVGAVAGLPAVLAVVHLVGLAYALVRRGTPRRGATEPSERTSAVAETESKTPSPSKRTATDGAAQAATTRAQVADDQASVASDADRRAASPSNAERAEAQAEHERTVAGDSSDMQRARDADEAERVAAEERARTTGVGNEPELPPGKVETGPVVRSQRGGRG